MGYVRFSLALVVLAAHAGFGFETIGSLGSVEAFFVLSGMYMAAVWSSKYSRIESGRVYFYLNRALRLWPTYLFVLAITFVAYILLGRPADEHNFVFNLFNQIFANGLEARSVFAIILNLVIVGQDIASVDQEVHFLFSVRQSWSIATELLFYALVPFIFKNAKISNLIFLFAALMASKIFCLYVFGWRYSYFFPVGNFSYFFLGGALYYVSQQPFVDDIKRRYPAASLWCTVLSIVVIFGFGESSLEEGGVLKHFAFIILFSFLVIFIFSKKISRIDAFLGNISYSVYLNHFVVIAILGIFGYSGHSLLVATIALSIALGYFTERALQRPVDEWRSSITRTGSRSADGQDRHSSGQHILSDPRTR